MSKMMSKSSYHADVDHHGPQPGRDDRVEVVAVVLVKALGRNSDLEHEAEREPGDLSVEQRVRRDPIRVARDKKRRHNLQQQQHGPEGRGEWNGGF